MKIPLIGIGAAAQYFLPSVAERLGTTVDFPEYCEVGNGIGAVVITCAGNRKVLAGLEAIRSPIQPRNLRLGLMANGLPVDLDAFAVAERAEADITARFRRNL